MPTMKTEGSHHTPEQVQKAFSYAPTLLQKLKSLGMEHARITLFSDASGHLVLGQQGEITQAQYTAAQSLIFSRRPKLWGNPDEIGIDFCCGLVQAAERAEK